MLFRRRSERRLPPPDAPPLVLPAHPAAVGAKPETLRSLLVHSWMGRVVLVAAAVRLAVWALEQAAGASSILQLIGGAASLALLVGVFYYLWRLLVLAKRRLLWRVRRKLTLSYIFIGVVPIFLIVGFFFLAGLLMFFHVSGYLFKRGMDDAVSFTALVAQTTAGELARERTTASVAATLERKIANYGERYPGLSLAVVPREEAAARGERRRLERGPWRHLDAPASVPAWVPPDGFSGLIAVRYTDDPVHPSVVVRSIAFPEVPNPQFAVVVDLPVDERVARELREATGVELLSIGLVEDVPVTPRPKAGQEAASPEGTQPTFANGAQAGAQAPEPAGAATGGRGAQAASGASERRSVSADAGPLVVGASVDGDSRWVFNWVSVFDRVRWDTGERGTGTASIRVNFREIYDRMSGAQSQVRDINLGDLFMYVLGTIAVLFLMIEIVALIMGLSLARSITGSVHALFEGTERVRLGDFSHRIRIGTKDQLGELAESFNRMAVSITELLEKEQEKKRLEQELRIAREIQMSLLPSGPVRLPGVSLAAMCVPAREVGGDYYDFFALSEHRLGILIADVAGKGTSAALYMAELKGLLLSLSEIHHSPRRLLTEVNRIISNNLDSRSFITMTYAVLDIESHTLTWARAGHTPLIYLPAGGGEAGAQALAPDGLVLGLRIEGVGAKFDALLTETSLAMHPGDVFVLYTDGVSEAMNAEADLFGEERLLAIVEQHAHRSSDQLRERILREVESFVGPADQHDDMTMILIKVDGDTGHGLVAGARATAAGPGA